MSDEIEKEAAPKRSGKKLLLAIVLVIGALAGGGAGAFFAGPKLADLVLGPADAAATTAVADSAAVEGAEEDHGGGHGVDAAATYMVENLVLNPAGSGGTRFLMVSVSFDVRDAEAVAGLAARDAQVRDALLTVLGHKTVEFLTDITHREELKTEIRTAVAGLFPSGTVGSVYFPQFVIQ